MALHKENSTQAQPVTVATPEVVADATRIPEQPQSQPTSAPQADTNFFQNQFAGLGNNRLDQVRNTLFKPLGGSAVNERITKIHQFFTQVVEEKRRTDPNVMDVRFVVAPSSRINNLYGGVVVCIAVNTPSGIVLGHHLLITENSLQYNKQTETFNGHNYTVYNTPGNTVTQETITLTEQLAKAGTGLTKATGVYAGYSVIPKEVTIEDESTLLDLLDNAAGAVLSAIQLQTGDVENDIALTLADAISSSDLTVYASVDEKPNDTVDIAGLPIRSDFRIKTVACQKGTQNQQFQAVDIGTVNVYCAPVYSQPGQIPTPNGTFVQDTRAYYNQVILRDIKTGPELRLSPSSLFLLMATAGLLTQNGLWKRKYVPNMHIPANQLDIADIGAFAYEVPRVSLTGRPEMFNTKTAEFTAEKFNVYMQALFHEQLLYQIDVPDGNFLLGILLAEANGQQSARDIIYNIINRMTGNVFSQHFGPTEQMFINQNVRVFTGHYTSADTGKLAPLENLDHLAMLNLTSGDTRSIQEFESSYVNAQSTALAIAIRTAITEELTGNTMEVRGYATRLTISPKFMESLINSLRSSKLFPEINSNIMRNQSYSRPTGDFWSRYAVDPNHIVNLFGGQNYNMAHNVGAAQTGFMGFMYR